MRSRDARVMGWPGASPNVYMTNESDALREMQAFINALPRRR